jgi:uncharacterized protein YjeT (DUF2065 family)
MWDSLWMALGLVLVIEGLMPALHPEGFRRTVQMMASLSNRFLRSWGLFSMSVGALIVYIVRG